MTRSPANPQFHRKRRGDRNFGTRVASLQGVPFNGCQTRFGWDRPARFDRPHSS